MGRDPTGLEPLQGLEKGKIITPLFLIFANISREKGVQWWEIKISERNGSGTVFSVKLFDYPRKCLRLLSISIDQNSLHS